MKLAEAILDRLDIWRHLVRSCTIDSRLSLVLRLTEQTSDDFADLLGLLVEERARAREEPAIQRAAAARPERWRTWLQRLDAAAYLVIAWLTVGGVLACSAFRIGWHLGLWVSP